MMDKHNKIKAYAFLVFLIIIIVGGYVLMSRTKLKTNDNKSNSFSQKEEKQKDIRKDVSKEYIYFENNNRIVDELDIEYNDIVINFYDTNNLANTLNEETKNLKNTIKYDETLEDSAYNKLSYAEYKKYNVYTFDDYISLVVDYYKFTSSDAVEYQKTKTYVFDKVGGKLYSVSDLLGKFNLNESDVKDKVKVYIEDQDLLKEEENLDADSTVSGLTELNVYVDKIGKLSISVLVKSDIKDYNDIIVLN